jgi:hypothetical protein
MHLAPLPRLTLSRILDELTPKDLSRLGPDTIEVEALSLAAFTARQRRTWECFFQDSPIERILTVPSVWFTKAPPEVQAERDSVLQEWKEAWGCSRIHVITTRTDWDGRSLRAALGADITLEAPRGLGAADVKGLHVAIDPFHVYGQQQESRLPRTLPQRDAHLKYWKIHGWHPARWIRRYSTEALQELWQLSVHTQATHVCLAHSQRVTQFKELKDIAASALQ